MGELMNYIVVRGVRCPAKTRKVNRVAELLAALEEYGVYWDECDPEMPKAKDFLNRLRNNERLREACMRVKRFNRIIELERKFQMGPSWVKIDIYTSNQKISDFLNSLRY